MTGKVAIKACRNTNGESLTGFIDYLRQLYCDKKLVIIWDGASYHVGSEMQSYLAQVNDGLEEDEWQIRCLLFAPNAPEQNPIEDIWLQGKNFVRSHWHLCDKFSKVKDLFLKFIQNAQFSFPKLRMYYPNPDLM